MTQTNELAKASPPKTGILLICDERPGETFTVVAAAALCGLAESTLPVYVSQGRACGPEQLHFKRAGNSDKAAVIESVGDELIVIASDPSQMASASNALIANMDQKIAESQRELSETETMISDARMAKIDDGAAVRLRRKIQGELDYFGKIRDALVAGYVIVPNFPGDCVAIRVQRAFLKQRDRNERTTYSPSVKREPSDFLPTGEGKYVDPVPAHQHWTHTEGDKKTHSLSFNGFIDGPIPFPAQFMRPTLVKKLGEAIKLKLFDELVLVNGENENTSAFRGHGVGDPLIVGRVRMRRGGYQQPKTVSFLIAWFVNTGDLI